MAITQNTYTGDGATVLFSFTFEYLQEADIKITLDGTPTTAYTLANPTTIQFNTAPGNNVAIRIYRDTDIDTLSAEFFPGSAIRAEDLNNNYTQNNYAVQEAKREADAAVTTSDNALSIVNSVVSYDPVVNVAAIPAAPSDGDRIEVLDSTGIESYTPLSGVPGGFIGASTLTVRLIYSVTTWVWQDYQSTDPDARYLKVNGDSTMTGNLVMGTNSITGLVDPTSAQEAATKNYVDTQVDGYTPRTSTTGSATLPSGTEAQRDGAPAAGYIRFNTDIDQFEGYNGTSWSSVGSGNVIVDPLYVDVTNNRVGIGITSPADKLHVNPGAGNDGSIRLDYGDGALGSGYCQLITKTDVHYLRTVKSGGGVPLAFDVNSAERARIDSSGRLLVGTPPTIVATASSTDTGFTFFPEGVANIGRASGPLLNLLRQVDDGELVNFYQGGSKEGSISVSGSTVTYGGGHLARWSQLLNNEDPSGIFKGTVMSNLDEMCEWAEEDNEQLNKTKVSDVEGDPNVAGVFVSTSFDDEGPADFFVAMTGDMIIRIAEGVTVQRGNLLMSAGDGTAKPQDDDIIRSKTVAKVTSTHVTCTYDDGSYCVPCVLMAC